jgi:O-antigen/teichoic acid export membrane protein
MADKQLRVGLPIHVSNVAQFLLLRADQLVLSVVAGATAVGMYSVSVNLVEALWMLPAAAGLASIPFLSGKAPEDQKQQAMMAATGISIWLTLIGAVFLGAVAPFLVPAVFGEGFAGAVLPLELLLPGIVAAALVRITTAALIAKKHTKPLVRYMLLALALNLGLNIALIPPFKASGAAMASSIAYTVLGIVLLREATRIWDVPVRGCLKPPVGQVLARLGRGKGAPEG